MIIRRATVSDVLQLVALNRAVQDMHANAFPGRFRRDAPEHVVVEAFTAMLASPSSYWLVADQEQQPLGFLSAEFRETPESWCALPRRSCYLAGIAVAPQAQRKGIARALVAALRHEAEARGVSTIDLDVWTFNSGAREVFAKLGFKPVMERMTFSPEAPKRPQPPMSDTPRSPQ